jgi:F-type H+-transporting ATPase subunit b
MRNYYGFDMFLREGRVFIAMGALQEVLTVLLGAESEARRIIEDAKNESQGVIRTTQEIFLPTRESKMAGAREQARSMMENALTAARTEAGQILEMGREERENVARRFEENADAVVASILAETADKILSEAR